LGGVGGTATIQHTAGSLNLGSASRIAAGGNLTWSGGTLAGALTVESNGYFILEGSALKTLNASVTNQGTIQFGGTGEIYAYGINGARVENVGVFEFVTDRELYGISGSPVFRNTGVLRKTGGTGTARLGVAGSYPVVLENTGLIESQTGVLQLFGGGTLAGQFVTATGARIELVGGTFTQTAAGAPVLSGSGATRLTGGTLQLHDQIDNLQLFGGTVVLLPDFQNGGAITNLTLEGATLAGSNVVIGTLTCQSLTGPLTVAGGGVVNWVNGTFTGPVLVQNGGVLTLSDTTGKNLNGALTNRGTVRIQ